MTKQVPKNFLLFFLLETLKNCTGNKKFNPYMTAIRVFPKIRTLFTNIQIKARETSLPFPPSCTPAEYGSDNHKTLRILIVRFHIRVIYYLLILLASPCFQHFSSIFHDIRKQKMLVFQKMLCTY